MHLTKPAGCGFQIAGFIILIIGVGALFSGGKNIVWGIILALLGGWMFWRGRRGPERKKEME